MVPSVVEKRREKAVTYEGSEVQNRAFKKLLLKVEDVSTFINVGVLKKNTEVTAEG